MTTPPVDAAAVARQRRNEYVEANLDLVLPIARSVVRRLPPSFELDDLVQSGMIGLLRAGELYRRSLNVPFRFYAQIRIRGEILESVRRRRYRDATNASLETHTEESYASEYERPANVVAIDEEISRREVGRRVAVAIEGLAVEDRDALHIYYLEEKRLAGIGERFGVKSSRSSQILRRALTRARAECAVHGIASAA